MSKTLKRQYDEHKERAWLLRRMLDDPRYDNDSITLKEHFRKAQANCERLKRQIIKEMEPIL